MSLQVYKEVTCRMHITDINLETKSFPEDETTSIRIIPAKPELRDNSYQCSKLWHKSRKRKNNIHSKFITNC